MLPKGNSDNAIAYALGKAGFIPAQSDPVLPIAVAVHRVLVFQPLTISHDPTRIVLNEER
jgi:hypothetical protein